jgi:nitrogen fixation protein FixH
LLVEGRAIARLIHAMLNRPTTVLAACLAAVALTAAPAAAQSPTDNPVPGATPGACADQTRPSSGFTRKAARRASRRHVLRGSARDVGCGVDRVQISVARKLGRKCAQLTRRRRLGRPVTCSRRIWLRVKGTTRWSFRLPNRLAAGRYMIRTRAIDFAGNVQRPRRRVLELR